MDIHIKGLEKHCRICARALHKYKCKRNCSQYKELLNQAYSINCMDDDEAIHPSKFCPPCFQRAGRIINAKAGEVFYESSVTPFPWVSHMEDGCSICEMITEHSAGGRSRKERKNRGHPGENSMHTLCQHIYTIAPTSLQVAKPLIPSRFQTVGSTVSLADFQCPCCMNILDRPILLSSCQKMICADCWIAHLQGGSEECPGCAEHHELNVQNIQSPPDVVVKLIGGLYVRCEGCQQYVQLQLLAAHVASGCQQHPQLLPDTTVGQLLSQSPCTPTTAVERRVATSLVKRMLAESPEGNVVQLSTGGQVILPKLGNKFQGEHKMPMASIGSSCFLLDL